jgi:hypothetical protein
MTGGHVVQAGVDALPHLDRAGQEVRVGDGLETLDGRRAGDGVPAVGRAQPSGVDGVHHLGRPDHAGQRHPGRERLPDRDDVGDDAGVLDAPQRAGAAHPGLDLVVDVEDAVLLAAGLQALDEGRRHHGEAALALDRLEDDARHRGRVHRGLEHPVERVERILRADPAVRVGCGRAVDLRGEGAHAALVDQLRREAHGQERPPVEAAVERDDRGPSGVVPGDLDGVLDRLGAGVDQHRLLLVRARREVGQHPAHLEVRLVRRDREARVDQLAGLR